jgi:hypothetical protein
LAEPHHVVVDGSNLATEGRTLPSLQQLDEAVTAYAEEDPNSRITVVVDASFEHRIDEAERETLREAMLNGEVVSPPAGAIGRGDAFVLRIAERTRAIVLSNDSFQEFHGEHPWLFEDGRLIGGKPVPGVGWIFTPRLPIRGPKSRAATADKRAKDDPGSSAPAKAAELARAAKKAAKRSSSSKKAAPAVSTSWPLIPSAPPPPPRGSRIRVDPDLSSAIDEAVAEALDPPKSVKVAKASKVAKVAKVAKGVKGAKVDKDPVKKKKVAAAKKDAAPKAGTTKKATTKSAASTSTATKKVTKQAVAKKAAATKKAAAVKKSSPEMKAEPVRKSTVKKSPPSPQLDQHPAKRRIATPPPAVNEPLAFITFVASYPVGTTLEGEVVSFTSHGAMVDVDLPDGGSLHCYIPLSAMGNPPPTKARQMLTKGEVRPFVLSSLDPPRRVAELSLPAPVAVAKRRRVSAKKAVTAQR